VKRSVSKGVPVKLDKPRINPLMKQAMDKKERRAKPVSSSFFGDFGVDQQACKTPCRELTVGSGEAPAETVLHLGATWTGS
jgi:hypothetical protein